MDYKFSIVNKTGKPVIVNATEQDSYDWSGNGDPKTQIKNIKVQDVKDFELSGKMNARDPWFQMEVKDDNIIASLKTKFDGQLRRQIVISGSGGDYVNENYSIERIYEKKDIYSYVITKVEEKKLRFLVSSDFHIKAESAKKTMLNNLATAVTNLSPLPSYYMICGDLTDNNDHDQEKIFEDFFEKMKRNTIVCDSFGNHDTLRKRCDSTDVKKGVAYRNTHYRKDLNLSNYQLSSNDFHYGWRFPMSKNGKTVNLYFFMLNNVAGYAERTKDDYYQKDEANPLYALNFLKDQLQSLTENDYYCLFFHVNFQCEKVDSNTPERWWTTSGKKDFYELIVKSKAHYVTSFFGHIHSLSNEENGVYEEFLAHNDDGLNKYEPIYGYRNRCEGGNGAKYFCMVDVCIVDGNILEVCIDPRNVSQNGGVNTENGELYLLRHDNQPQYENDTARKVTLRFDLQSGKELDRRIERK